VTRKWKRELPSFHCFSLKTAILETVLLVISGAPASGKTTLGRAIASSLKVPLVRRGDLKWPLYRLLKPYGLDSEILREAGRLAWYGALRAILEAGCSALADGALNDPEDAARLHAFLTELNVPAAEILLFAEPNTLRRRFFARGGPAVHEHLVPSEIEPLLQRDWQPLLGNAPLLRIDTTDWANLDHAQVTAWVRQLGMASEATTDGKFPHDIPGTNSWNS